MRAETFSPPPEMEQSEKKELMSRTTTTEADRAKAITKTAEERVIMRKREAQQIVETELKINSDIDVLITKLENEINEIRTKISELKEADTQMEQDFELAQEKHSHALAVKTEREASSVSTPEPVVEQQAVPVEPTITPAKNPGFLSRFNGWLRGSGKTERPTLSTSAYDKTQSEDAQTARDAARVQELGNIADNALRANTVALQADQDSLTLAEENIKSASFLTRWRYRSQISELKASIKFREAAISARKTQLKNERLKKEKLQEAQAAK